MGNFVHHNIGGVIAGTSCGVIGYIYASIPLPESVSAGVLCYISSLLPDIDSPVSKPAEFIVNICSALAPALLFSYFSEYQLRPSSYITLAMVGYMGTGFLIKQIIRRITVHRGIIHSIPMSVMWGACVYVLLRKESVLIQNVMTLSAIAGFIVHLLIDEMFSVVDISGGTFMPKRSFGTALKLSGMSIITTICMYAALCIILWYCFMKLS